MKWLEAIIYYAFPTLRVRATPWFTIWREKDRRNVLVVSRIASIGVALTYIAHYFLIDHPLHLQPHWLWAFYRFGVAALAFLMFGATFLRSAAKGRFYRLPFTIIIFAASILQAMSMTWDSRIPYYFGLLIPLITIPVLQTTQLKSALILFTTYACQWSYYQRADAPQALLISGGLVSMAALFILRGRMASDIAAFLAEQEKLETHKKLIESEIELNEEIRSFLPKEIFRRVLSRIKAERVTVLQVMDEELRPRVTSVACVFSDIRGYTEKSKDLDGYLLQSALPNIRLCTEVVESYGGIPRLVGDLVFSYFDRNSVREKLMNALQCGIALVDMNNEWNSAVPEENRVRRFVLVSFGDAIVGNIGGAASAREITAMGPPVNILSRIDNLTKEPVLAHAIGQQSLVLTRETVEAVRFCSPDVDLRKLDLAPLGLSIRDFPEEQSVWLLPVHSSNRQKIISNSASTNELPSASPVTQ